MDYTMIDCLLALPAFKIADIDMDDKHILCYLVHEKNSVNCPECQFETSQLHQNHIRRVRDLSILGRECYLEFVRRRFECSRCHHIFSEEVSFVESNRNYTTRYQDYIYHRVCGSSLTAVAHLEGLSYEVVEGIFFMKPPVMSPNSHLKD